MFGFLCVAFILLKLITDRIAVAQDLTVFDADDSARVALGQLRVVRDHNNQFVCRNLLEQFHDLHRCLRVKSTGRFVCKQDIRIIYQSAGNCNALHLSAGHLIWFLVQLVSQPDLFKRFPCAAAALGLADTGDCQCKLHIGKDGLMRDQIVGLKYKAYGMISISVPIGVSEVFCRFAVYDKVSGGVFIQAAYDIQQRCFTASGMSKNRNKFTFPEPQVDSLQGVDLLVAGQVILFDIF